MRRRAKAGLVGRWGGEEFLVLAPGTDVGGAGVMAEDLRASLEERAFDTSATRLSVTASFGVAQLHDGESPEQLLARADVALYAAKAQGRNAVRLAEEDAASCGRMNYQPRRSIIRSSP